MNRVSEGFPNEQLPASSGNLLSLNMPSSVRGAVAAVAAFSALVACGPNNNSNHEAAPTQPTTVSTADEAPWEEHPSMRGNEKRIENLKYIIKTNCGESDPEVTIGNGTREVNGKQVGVTTVRFTCTTEDGKKVDVERFVIDK